GLCEVVTCGTLFYTDVRGQHLIIGRVYDLESRSDLTAARLLEIAPEMLLAGAPRVREADAPAAGAAEASSRIDPGALPSDGAIAWGPAGGPRVAVFSDLACGYCRQLHGELRAIGARVTEHPISVLGSRRLAEFVWCAPDRVEALHAIYSGRDEVPAAFQPSCDTAGLDANQEFARRVGFQGTPVLVRSDGEVLVGYRPASELRRWLAMAGKPIGEGEAS
ncbi:MAG: DsbC family protein, partial [Thermaurantiacus sp.]